MIDDISFTVFLLPPFRDTVFRVAVAAAHLPQRAHALLFGSRSGLPA